MSGDNLDDEEIRALIIVDCIAQAEEWQKLIANSACRDRIRPIYPSAIKKEKASFDSLLEDCRNTIYEDNDIDAIISFQKEYAFIQAILVKEFDLQKQKVPSFESLVVCLHKYYTKHRLIHGFHFPYQTIDVEDATISDYEAALDETEEPALLIDAISTTGALVKKITVEHLSVTELEKIRQKVTANFDIFKDILAKYTPSGRENYPHIFEPVCIIEEYWKAFYKDVSFHQVECCVSTDSRKGKQELVPWALTDLEYSSGKRRSLKYVGTPSQIPSQTNIWAVLYEVYETLLSFGFQNYFFNAIVISSSNGDVKIADINPGVIKENAELYKHTLSQGDNIQGIIDAGLGKMQRTPKTRLNRYSMRAEIRTFAEQCTVEDIIDLKLARSTPEVELLVQFNDQHIVHDMDEGGMHIANVYLNMASKAECQDSFAKICNSIMKTKSKMNWNMKENQGKKTV